MDGIVAVLAVATSVLAVMAGLDRWLLTSVRQRQYSLLTQMRNDEGDVIRRMTLDDARTKATAVQVAAFWVPSTRMLHLPVVTAVVAYASYVGPGAVVERHETFGWIEFLSGLTFLTMFECLSLFPADRAYRQRMRYARKYLRDGFLIDQQGLSLGKRRGALLFLSAAMLVTVSMSLGLSGLDTVSSAAQAGFAVFGMYGVIAWAFLARHLYRTERDFMHPHGFRNAANAVTYRVVDPDTEAPDYLFEVRTNEPGPSES